MEKFWVGEGCKDCVYGALEALGRTERRHWDVWVLMCLKGRYKSREWPISEWEAARGAAVRRREGCPDWVKEIEPLE